MESVHFNPFGDCYIKLFKVVSISPRKTAPRANLFGPRARTVPKATELDELWTAPVLAYPGSPGGFSYGPVIIGGSHEAH